MHSLSRERIIEILENNGYTVHKSGINFFAEKTACMDIAFKEQLSDKVIFVVGNWHYTDVYEAIKQSAKRKKR